MVCALPLHPILKNIKMKIYTSILVLAVAIVFSACSTPTDKTNETETTAVVKTNNKSEDKQQQPKVGPWAGDQIMEPAELSAKIEEGEVGNMKIYSVGPSALITSSVEIGDMQYAESQDRFREELSKLDKDEEIVVYCGCCPFTSCPNFKPAYKVLNEMGFTNFKLLNLKQNLKTDWIDKNYPTID